MKKKQLKKRIKAKKGLTSAAVALLMSGSLLPVGNVFANEQSTQENSISNQVTSNNLSDPNLKTQSNIRTTNGRVQLAIPTLSTTALSNGNLKLSDGWVIQARNAGSGEEFISSNTLSNTGCIIDNATGSIWRKQVFVSVPNNNSISINYPVGSGAYQTVTKAIRTRGDFSVPTNRTYKIPINLQGNASSSVRICYQNQIEMPNNLNIVYSSGELKFKPKETPHLTMVYRATVANGQQSSLNFGQVSMVYATQWNQVDDLFGNSDHTILAPGINGTSIQSAIQMAQNLPDSNEDKQEILAEANKAWNLYQLKTTTLDNINSDSTVVTGTGEPGGTVIIRKEDGTELGRGTIDSNGHYSVDISKQSEGTRIKAEVSYNGKTSISNVVTVSQGTIAQTTIDNNLTTDSTKVTGTGEPGGTV
ncbi:hypothetical protein GVK83_12520, partial [Enterococcus hirae]